MKAILYVGHGTRSKKGAEEANQFIQRVMDQVEVPIQEISFLELTPPLISKGFERCIERGATEISVVPLFLLAAGHIKLDIPEALAPLIHKYPAVRVSMADPFGIQDRILDGICELVQTSAGSISPADSILIVGRGSSDPAIHQSFEKITSGIQDRLSVNETRVCYLAAAEPSFQDGIESISLESPGRVIVIPYLLFSGLLLNEINIEVKKRQKKGQDILHTGPLCRHQAISDIVIERTFLEGGTVYAAADY
ncbi:sirohydrochlorin ferrochelatase [Peribacillus deserti]|uniref:Sirohydrochlorin ferrochelatase n=1 Tax=Peribacillus deserti TaxID=673318 RepID=A0ABS2QKC9_9BACI|nr:sirohydrochlorin chelatase [Peribacillus deserti]MBM7693631.1 sirohydrochlorin ferrochelatase [Peribacillus deserti]